VDCLGPEFNVLSDSLTTLDGVILIVAADRGVEARTRETLLLARQAGVRSVLVFLSRTDQVAEAQVIDRVEIAVRQLLNQLEYPGDDVPVIQGNVQSAAESDDLDDHTCRALEELLSSLDLTVRPSPRDPEAPLLLPVARGDYSILDGHVIVQGRVARGRVRPGQLVELPCAPPKRTQLLVDKIWFFGQPWSEAGPGHAVQLRLVLPPGSAAKLPFINPAQVVAEPGSIHPRRRFRAQLSVTARGEGKGARSLRMGMRPSFWLGTSRIRGRITEAPGNSLAPGSTWVVAVELDWPCFIQVGQLLACRHRNAVIAHGHVEALLR